MPLQLFCDDSIGRYYIWQYLRVRYRYTECEFVQLQEFIQCTRQFPKRSLMAIREHLKKDKIF